VALVLAVDCSFSVDSSEYKLQMQGLAQAFASREIIAAIEQGSFGRIAVMVVQWSGARTQKVVVPWTIVDGRRAANRVSDAISATPRLTSEQATSVSGVIDFGVYQLSNSPIRALRNVIDISSDGYNNEGGSPEIARDRALAAGFTINGLAILNEVPWLNLYFESRIVGGTGHFVMVADDYAAYPKAIKRKLLKEIKTLPFS